MTMILGEELRDLAPVAELTELPHPQADRYVHHHFTEVDEELMHRAWRMHAEGYREAGFITFTDAEFPPEMDNARGANVDYHIAAEAKNKERGATLREIHIPDGGTFRDLLAFYHTSSVMLPEKVALLERLTEEGYEIKEIAAMGQTSADPTPIYELLRDVANSDRGKKVVWLFSIVKSTLYDHMYSTLGQDNFDVLGGEVSLHNDDEDGITDKVVLTPAILYPNELLDSMLSSIPKEVDRPAVQRRLLKNLVFFAHGLDREQLSGPVDNALVAAQAVGIGGTTLRTMGQPFKGKLAEGLRLLG